MSAARRRESRGDLIEWFTISYKSIAKVVLVLAFAGLGAFIYFYPKYLARQRELLPPPPPTALVQFSWIDGSVEVKAAGATEWRRASEATALSPHDFIRTAANATTEILFFDGTIVRIGPDSLVSLEDISENPTTHQRRVVWHIVGGEAQIQTAAKRQPQDETTVVMATGQASLSADARAHVSVSAQGASTLRLFAGAGEVETATAHRYTLSPATGIALDPQGQTEGVVKLLPPPTIVAPAPEETIPVAGVKGASVRLRWAPVPGAVSYRVVLDKSGLFNWPIVDQTGIEGTSIDLKGLDVGRYYWRLAAIGDNALAGDFSAPSRLIVVPKNAEPPKLVIDSTTVRGSIVQITGRTEPGSIVTIDRQHAKLDEKGSFSEFLTVARVGPQELRVRVIGPTGGIAESTVTVTISY
jgi:hypothetical protein